ncbi:D-2-hydroxyacid dehydrogenase [Pollutimonas sp. H1-120]|uniref:D-2-hydroxyacid dehydrogenase n=1 Tax=Pollutimonas sp. H1-120 TaxID=3148824 RepID=UPI003B52BB9C
MPHNRPFRILLSEATFARIGDAMASALNGRPFEPVFSAASASDAPVDVDAAFISRDVTGLSTKYVVQEPLQAFYESLRLSPGLRWVHAHSAGADRPIFPELIARGVRVTMSPGANADVVVQTALAGMLSLARHFPKLLAAQHARQWAPLIGERLPADMAGQTAVIVGWGPIGQRLGAFLRMLGMNVIALRRASATGDEEVETHAFEALNDLAPQADWLILACPLTDRTRQLVDRRTFAAIKPGARLINVARGEVVVESDLIRALREGVLSGAHLDVFEHEPLQQESPLWALDNVLVTPHSAGHSDGNVRRVDQIFLQHLREWAA